MTAIALNNCGDVEQPTEIGCATMGKLVTSIAGSGYVVDKPIHQRGEDGEGDNAPGEAARFISLPLPPM
jgi:hypothetical protein